MRDAVRRNLELAFEGSLHFRDDFLGPSRPVQRRSFGQPQQRIAKWRLDQDVGVENDGRKRRLQWIGPLFVSGSFGQDYGVV